MVLSLQKWRRLTDISDGSTPEKQTEQILAITPILPGQKPNQRNRIPKRSESYRSTTNEYNNENVNSQQTPKQQLSQAPEGDLIDFGQDEEPQTQNQNQRPSVMPPIPTDLRLAQTQNNGQKQKDLEKQLHSTSISPPPPTGALIDFQDDLKKDLPKQDDLKRHDTADSDDVFLDAEGWVSKWVLRIIKL